MLGNALYRIGEWSDSAAAFREAARIRPTHADTHLNLGHALYRTGAVEESVVHWREAVSQSPGDALPHLALALGLASMGEFEQGRPSLVRALRLDQDAWKRLEIDIRWTPEMVEVVTQMLEEQD